MKNKIIINADDLGLSKGVNKAVYNAYKDGFLSHASLMANGYFFNDALDEVVSTLPKLRVGLHINLTCCKALVGKCILTDEKGLLSKNFISLLLMRKTKKNLEIIETEIELQFKKLIDNNIQISHIDGHEHVHVIPSINKIVQKLAEKYKIGRIREINENFVTTFKYNLRTGTIANLIKLFLLKFLSFFNKNKKEIEFYTILNTCEINAQNLFKYLESENGKMVEVMLHPALEEENIDSLNLDKRFKDFLKSDFRKKEFDLCFNKKFEEYGFLD